MWPLDMLKSKKNFTVIPIPVEEVSSDCHKCLAKRRGPAIKCNREWASRWKLTEHALLLFLDFVIQKTSQTAGGRNIELWFGEPGVLQKLFKLWVLNSAEWETGGCDKLEDLLLEGRLAELRACWLTGLGRDKEN